MRLWSGWLGCICFAEQITRAKKVGQAALIGLLTFFLTTYSIAGDRVALVIGNQRYAMAPLETPEADARAMAEKLIRAGYKVTKQLNLRQTEFYDAIDTFFSQNKSSEAVLFFYAGHAVQINGKNFLIPIDIKKEDPDLLSRMFDLRYLMTKMTEIKSETKLVILDACRDNIFSSNPNAASGLSELISPPGTFVAFSTAPGSTAEDGDGENSPYTTALLESLFRPNVKIEDSFKDVRRKVRFLTENAQTPWESTSLVQDFFVVPNSTPLNPVRRADGKDKAMPKTKITNPGADANRMVGSVKEKSDCSRILMKMSMGMDPLSSDESSALMKCKR